LKCLQPQINFFFFTSKKPTPPLLPVELGTSIEEEEDYSFPLFN
jgi:hypothetical protein